MTSSSDEVATLRAQLEEKQLELDNHQVLFDTYVREREALDKEYESYCSQYEEQIEALEKQLSTSRESLEESMARQTKSNAEISRLTVEMSELRKNLSGAENVKRQLEQSNDDLESKARALEAEVTLLREKNDHLLEEKVLVSHELEDLRIKQSEVQERLKQELVELREDLEARRKQENGGISAEDVMDQLLDTEEKLKQSESRAQELEKQVSSMRKLLEEQSKTARSVTKKYDEARGILDQYKSNHSRIQSLQDEVVNLQESLVAQQSQTEVGRRLRDAEQLVRAREGRIQSLEEELRSSKQRAQSLQDEMLNMKKALSAQMETRAASQEQFMRKFTEMEGLVKLRDGRIQALEKELLESSTKVQAAGVGSAESVRLLETKVGDLQKELKQASDRVQEKEDEVQLLMTRVGSLQKELESKVSALGSLEQQLKMIEERDSALATAIPRDGASSSAAELAGLQAYVEETQSQMADQAVMMSKLEEELVAVKAERDGALASLQAVRDEASLSATRKLTKLEATLKERMDELASQATRITGLEEELVKAKLERDQALSRISDSEKAATNGEQLSRQSTVQTPSKRLAALEEELVSLRSQMQGLTKERDQAVESLSQARKEVQELHEMKMARADGVIRIHELEEEVDRLCKLGVEADSVIEEQNERIQELVLRVDTASREAVEQALAARSPDDQSQATASREREVELMARVADLEAVIVELRRKRLLAKPANPEPRARLTFSPLMPSRGQEAVDRALASGDVKVLCEQLKDISDRYNAQRLFNSRLLSRLQNTQSKIQVCCRIRPLNEAESAGDGKVVVEALSEFEVGYLDRKMGHTGWRSFAFDRVWGPQHSQEDIFLDIEPLALSTINGSNACIMAYGQTGSGKTHTMQGGEQDYGISYRVMYRALELLNFRKETTQAEEGEGASPGFEFEVQMAMVEVYNEDVRDLLRPDGPGVNLEIKRDAEGALQIPGMSQEKVTCLEDAMRVIDRGNKNRVTASTNIHEHSSRSHSVLIVDISTNLVGVNSTKGRLYLVDLAGSERVKKSAVTGPELREAQYINRSLSALGDVMEALDSKSSYIPYRNSRLTYLLQDSLGGGSRTLMIVTASPMEETADESLFTLHFATRVRSITLTPAASHLKTRNLEQDVKEAKRECRMMAQKRAAAEEALTALKKAHTASQKRANTAIDLRNQSFEETRRIMEGQLSTLRSHAQELQSKFLQEKSYREKLASELDVSQREVRKLQSQVEAVTLTCADFKSLAVSKELEIAELRRSFRSTRRSPTDSGTTRRSSIDGFSVDDDAVSEGGSRGGEPLPSKRRDSRRLSLSTSRRYSFGGFGLPVPVSARSSPTPACDREEREGEGDNKAMGGVEVSVTGAGIESRSSPSLPLPPPPTPPSKETSGKGGEAGETDDISYISGFSSSISTALPPPVPGDEGPNPVKGKGGSKTGKRTAPLPRVALLAASASITKSSVRTTAREKKKGGGPMWKN